MSIGSIRVTIPIVANQNFLVDKVHQWTWICEVCQKTSLVGVYTTIG